MPRTEIAHYTREQVEQHLTDALQLTAELEPPDELRGLVFAKAVDMLSHKQIFHEQVAAILGGPSGVGH